jgi:hypothetical protein
MHDYVALHFMNAQSKAPQDSSVPEQLRKNSLAMEVLSTLPAFSTFSYQRDKDSYFACLSEVGGALGLIVAISKNSTDINDFARQARFMLATTIALKALPEGHRLKSRQQLLYGEAPRKASSATDPRLWPGETQTPLKYGKAVSVKVSNPFADKADNERQRAIVKVPESAISSHFYEVLADILKVGVESVTKAESLEEINHVFSTWRRPQLLLDYFRIHAATPEIQSLYRRFLNALFAISTETVDMIRFEDKSNKCHLDRFPQELVVAWREGTVSREGTQVLLPGYNDAQTFFMLGEDCNTCMSIRSKQKGSNRGLSGFLLHGSYRVLGPKDASGCMAARAVIQLVIDDATNTPVLYMHGPQGDMYRVVDVSSTLAAPLYYEMYALILYYIRRCMTRPHTSPDSCSSL